MDRATVEAIAALLDDKAERQSQEARRFAHASNLGRRAVLRPDKGEFDPTVVRSTRLILADFCRDLASELRSLA